MILIGRTALLLLVLRSIGPVSGQEVEAPPQTLEPAPLGGAISVPLPSPRERQLKKYEVPELAGARHVSGSQLINGRLPFALVDYSVRYPGVLERVTIFEGGLVAIRIEGRGGTIQKRMILPQDAFDAYIRHLKAADLEEIRISLTGESPGSARIRIRDAKGKVVERPFDPSIILPTTLEQQRTLLRDLLRAMSEDRDVTNPMSGYVPRIGDRLVADDKRSYQVTRLLNGGEIVELTCIGQPSHMYVSTKDLHNLFIGARGASPTPR